MLAGWPAGLDFLGVTGGWEVVVGLKAYKVFSHARPSERLVDLFIRKAAVLQEDVRRIVAGK